MFSELNHIWHEYCRDRDEFENSPQRLRAHMIIPEDTNLGDLRITPVSPSRLAHRSEWLHYIVPRRMVN